MKGRKTDEAMLKERHVLMQKAQAQTGQPLTIRQIAATWYLSTSPAWNYLQKLVERGMVIVKKYDRYHVVYWAVSKPIIGGKIVFCPYCGAVLVEGDGFVWQCLECAK